MASLTFAKPNLELLAAEVADCQAPFNLPINRSARCCAWTAIEDQPVHTQARTELILTFHNHQPVGNFPEIFRRAYDQCYRPLLDLVAVHPEVHVALHHSGPLFEWLLKEAPAYLADLKILVERKQVEVVGGGFYEPMLAMLSDTDKRGQIDMMNGFCDRHLETRPQGIWLAERVWDPDLPRALAPAGVHYTFVDDSHLYSAGLRPPADLQFSGYYVSERAGSTLAVFPILRSLRYAIPFHQPEEVLDTVNLQGQGLRKIGREAVLTYGDDGEKFGLWPGTEGMAQKGGWLDRFFHALSDRQEFIMTSTPSSVLARHRACGRVYMPAGSYEEMDLWTLPAEAACQLQKLREVARDDQDSPFAQALPFLRGGIWSGFLAKYPEANLMHKRMVQVSEKLADAFVAQRAGALFGEADQASDVLATAQRALYAGQCNNAYWHGWFGGIYAPHLRQAILSQLVRADVLLDDILGGKTRKASFERLDFDGDLADEVLLHNNQVNAFVCPHPGGSMFAFDHRRSQTALVDVLARHPESYHDSLKTDSQRASELGLVFDDSPRQAFVDRCYAKDCSAETLRDQVQRDLSDFAQADYSIIDLRHSEGLEGAVELVLRTEAKLRGPLGESRLRMTKRFVVSDEAAAVQVVYSISHDGGPVVDALFAPELSWSLPDSGAEVEVKAQRFSCEGSLDHQAQELLLDPGEALPRVVLSAESAIKIWQYPVVSVSRGQQDWVRSVQGLAVHPVFELKLRPGEIVDFAVLLGFEAAPTA